MTTIEAPLELVTSVADLRFPAKIDAHLQALMDRNTEGQLSDAEREEFEALVELSETISFIDNKSSSLQVHSGTRLPSALPN